ncbi:hypothetical protein [Alkaliphilus sp. B6464]|uniref:hypothetical protein n=1 Tax=Alkaliphilus sp. B6464 TaxID=2731219 RepID=UPI001BA76BBD|nr:hypothetical protein [Alkaliphilus sp. B6464]QUH22147.1 hypothetical protein HYG84_19765 [Alkaliphilus sp. B6464]
MEKSKILTCDCRDYIFRNGDLICKKCKKPMQSQKKPITSKGLRHKSGMYGK